MNEEGRSRKRRFMMREGRRGRRGRRGGRREERGRREKLKKGEWDAEEEDKWEE